MSHQPAAVETFDTSHAEASASIIGRAFHNDPLFAFACPDPELRTIWLPLVMRWCVWRALFHGRLLGLRDPLRAVAALVPPPRTALTDAELEQIDYALGRDTVGADHWDAANAALQTAFLPADTALQALATQPHWYLDVIAVDPAWQGRGDGGRLLNAAATIADGDGLPIVLETFNPSNVAFYQRYEYEVVGSDLAPENGPPWWVMMRQPAKRQTFLH